MTDAPSDGDLLATFHAQVRATPEDGAEPPPGIVHDWDGPVRRRYPQVPGASYAMIDCPGGLGDDAEHWIARQVAFFTDRGEQVEWKSYSYDSPTDLVERLAAHGFAPGEPEGLLLGELADLAGAAPLPAGLAVRPAQDEADFARTAALLDAVWGASEHNAHLAAELWARKQSSPQSTDMFLVEGAADGPVLAAGRIDYPVGVDFAGLWGGSTHPEWRRQGLYRALVAARAREALRRGYRYARVDTSPDSRPILLGLGLRLVAWTTPCVLSPADR